MSLVSNGERRCTYNESKLISHYFFFLTHSIPILSLLVQLTLTLPPAPTEGATVYYTSIRRGQLDKFEILRFLVVSDSGQRISLL